MWSHELFTNSVAGTQARTIMRLWLRRPPVHDFKDSFHRLETRRYNQRPMLKNHSAFVIRDEGEIGPLPYSAGFGFLRRKAAMTNDARKPVTTVPINPIVA